MSGRHPYAFARQSCACGWLVMSDPLGGWIPGVSGLDPLTGTLTLPLWAAGALTALFVVFCALALSRAGRDGIVGGVARIALVLVGAVLAWFFLEGTTKQDAAAERRALEARAGVLATRATMPGSPLACLDAMAGDAVEALLRAHAVRDAGGDGIGGVLCGGAAQPVCRRQRVRQSRQFRAGAAAGEPAARGRDRPLRSGRPCAGDARRLHGRAMPRIGADARCAAV